MQAIAGLLENDSVWDQQAQMRSDLRSLYFAPYFGFSTQVAAQTLLNLDRVLNSPGNLACAILIARPCMESISWSYG